MLRAILSVLSGLLRVIDIWHAYQQRKAGENKAKLDAMDEIDKRVEKASDIERGNYDDNFLRKPEDRDK